MTVVEDLQQSARVREWTGGRFGCRPVLETAMSSKRLYRSNENRVFLGVCGGLGEHFDVDPTWVRLAFIAAAFLGGPGLLAYLLMVVIVPRQNALPSVDRTAFQSTALRTR